jgi:HSP20 family molecular chaperone IbpA
MMSFMAQAADPGLDNFSLGVPSALLPDVGITDCGDCYLITANLRGLSAAEVRVRLEARILTITADDLSSVLNDDDEIPPFGAFRYVIGLPADADDKHFSTRVFGGRLVLTAARMPA